MMMMMAVIMMSLLLSFPTGTGMMSSMMSSPGGRQDPPGMPAFSSEYMSGEEGGRGREGASIYSTRLLSFSRLQEAYNRATCVFVLSTVNLAIRWTDQRHFYCAHCLLFQLITIPCTICVFDIFILTFVIESKAVVSKP